MGTNGKKQTMRLATLLLFFILKFIHETNIYLAFIRYQALFYVPGYRS